MSTHTSASNTIDKLLLNKLNSYAAYDNDYWSFRDKLVREQAHGYFRYPAKMVPQMQGELIQTVLDLAPHIEKIYDPFVGSGTVMTEAMNRGLDFIGQDVNPLAVLLCLAKIGPFHKDELISKIALLNENINNDISDIIEVDFPGRDKWFRHDIAIKLSKIKRAIQKEQDLWVRRFFWVALAETVRLASNSRTSTFKLHVREKQEIETRNICPITHFKDILKKNLKNFLMQRQFLSEKNLLINDNYIGKITVRLEDTSKRNLSSSGDSKADLLVTSPPYGDNKTTVPYGQYSYLPLQWIDLHDIDINLGKDCLSTTHEIDSLSLGGILNGALEFVDELAELSPSFKDFFDSLKNEPRDRSLRIAAFCRDFNKTIDPILAFLKPNSYMIWTVGNRRIANRSVPIDSILSEFLTSRGAGLVARIQRNIPVKRMALKNTIAVTMGAESALIFRKGNS